MDLEMSHATAYKNKIRTKLHQTNIPHLRRVPGAVPLSILGYEGHHPFTPHMIILIISSAQALIKLWATSPISKNYTPADSRANLLALGTCPPIFVLGFSWNKLFDFLLSTMLKYGQSHTCARKLATAPLPPSRRLLSNFYSHTTPNAAEHSVLLTLTRISIGDHLSLKTTSFSL